VAPMHDVRYTNCFGEVMIRLIGGGDFEVDAKKTALALA
jgi:hypothetical protein